MSFREEAMQAPRKQQDVATPFWPATDGHAAIVDVPMPELMELNELSKTDVSAYSTALILRCLIDKRTGEPAFQAADRDWLMSQASIVLALKNKANEFFGFTGNAVEAAKNG